MKISERDRYNRRKMEEFYDEIVSRLQHQCETELQQLNIEFYGENVKLHNQIHQYMSKENVTEMKRRKEEIRWEFAWQVFDEVNQGLGLNNQFEVDLNGLVTEEALAICKQVIYDLAKRAREERESFQGN